MLAIEFCILCKRHLTMLLPQVYETTDVSILFLVWKKTWELEDDLEQRFKSTQFKGLISSSFAPFLDSYVRLEERNMREEVDKLCEEEKHTSSQSIPPSNVFPSSSKLFSCILHSRRRCPTFSNHGTLLSLCQVYKQMLGEYSKILLHRLPRGAETLYSQPESPTQISLTEVEQNVVCYVINTASYCVETIPGLVESTKKMVGEEFYSNVNFDESIEPFSNILSLGLACLVRGVDTKLNDAFLTMTKRNWTRVDDVGDHSDFVTVIGGVVQSVVPRVASALVSVDHFQFFCQKLAQMIMARFTASIFRCRRVHSTGAQQLLVDAYALRKILLGIPGIIDKTTGVATASVGSSTFAKYVNQEMMRIEKLLKVIAASTENLVDTYTTLVDDRNLADLSRIMTLKVHAPLYRQDCNTHFFIVKIIKKTQGVKRTDHPSLVEIFSTDTSRPTAIKTITPTNVNEILSCDTCLYPCLYLCHYLCHHR
eukprot:GILJ01015427.1.p1 GENE.GILJ01015427.1~~GILJ01015427.1.p1  ORF type:complete len:482 (-),score=41.37 GILJ01015427.1:431-1876(-)